MINSWTELEKAIVYLDRLQSVFCVKECSHDATRCPVVKYLIQERLTLESNPQAYTRFFELSKQDFNSWSTSLYPQMEFCPYCGGYQDRVERIKKSETKKSKLSIIPKDTHRYNYTFEGGYLIVPEVHDGIIYHRLCSCTENECQAGSAWRKEPFNLARFHAPEELSVLLEDKCYHAVQSILDDFEKTIIEQFKKGGSNA